MSLRFGEGVSETIRRRLEHAFRSFCFVYGFRPTREGDVRLVYGAAARDGELALATGYTPRAGARRRTPPEPYRKAGLMADGEPDAFPCFHPASGGGGPDWLGEIFEWLGGESDRLAEAVDSVGRVAFSETLHGLHDLDPEVAWAGVAMRGLNQDIAAHAGPGWPDSPVAPAGVGSFAIVATHDLDFLPVSPPDTLARALKNAGIAAVAARDPALVLQILAAIGRDAVRRRSPLDTLDAMEALERELGIRSACFVICSRGHRRDANYTLPQVRERLARLAAAGMEIGVHGSYTSLSVPGQLQREYEALRELGFPARGGRQHWLRYRNGELYDALSQAGAEYDCSAGYAHRIGFRGGACFPFVPWDFSAEAPYPIVEIPLVLMDVALYTQFRRAFTEAERRARRLLRRASRYGWGGVSLVWHNTVFGGAQVPMPLGDLYWQLKEPDQRWTGGAELMDALAPRLTESGLTRAR